MSLGPKAVELKRSFDEEEDNAYEEYLRDASMKSRSELFFFIILVLFFLLISLPRVFHLEVLLFFHFIYF